MPVVTQLIGQDDPIGTLNHVLKDPPHLFLSGAYGIGKTTLINDFIKAYYAQYGISHTNPEWVLWLSSEQDRGIHCVRQSVAEFVRHSSAKEGVYRFIVIDDADSLPIISQQAIRRPMETHVHTTRFLFASRYISDLIKPLKSRCLHIELEILSPMVLITHFCGLNGFPGVTLDPMAIRSFMSLAHTPTEIKNACGILCSIKKEGGTPFTTITSQDVIQLFASPSFSLCLEILHAYVRGNRERIVELFLEIWTTGISYEDFLHELTSSVGQMGILSPAMNQMIHQLILKGWILFAQGKTHTLDLMRLFFA
jgi:DNA polymerase III gamma/tau subunit